MGPRLRDTRLDEASLFYLWRSHKVYKSPPILTSLGAWGKCKCKGGMINCRSFWGHGQSVIVGVNLFGGMGSVVM